MRSLVSRFHSVVCKEGLRPQMQINRKKIRTFFITFSWVCVHERQRYIMFLEHHCMQHEYEWSRFRSVCLCYYEGGINIPIQTFGRFRTLSGRIKNKRIFYQKKDPSWTFDLNIIIQKYWNETKHACILQSDLISGS